MESLKIGQVASRAGVSIDAIRYYERVGILPSAERRESGYRIFNEQTVARIQLVRQLQELSLSLEEIAAMLNAVEDGADCSLERHRIEQALITTEARIAALQGLRERLRGVLVKCDVGTCDLVSRAQQTGPGRGQQRRNLRSREAR